MVTGTDSATRCLIPDSTISTLLRQAILPPCASVSPSLIWHCGRMSHTACNRAWLSQSLEWGDPSHAYLQRGAVGIAGASDWETEKCLTDKSCGYCCRNVGSWQQKQARPFYNTAGHRNVLTSAPVSLGGRESDHRERIQAGDKKATRLKMSVAAVTITSKTVDTPKYLTIGSLFRKGASCPTQ